MTLSIKKYYYYNLFMRIMLIVIPFMLIHTSCKKAEDKELKNYYSAGAINTRVVSHTYQEATVKVRFFVWDKENNDGLIPFNINERIQSSEYSYHGTFDSLKRVTTPYEGNFSAAVLISDGLDVDEGMEDFFEVAEPAVRKFIHTATPFNEVMVAKAGNNKNPVEILGDGFTTDGSVFDQDLANIYKKGNYMATDSLSLLKSMDSVFNYMLEKAKYTNMHLIIVISRRINFYQDVNMTSLMNKALFNGINCHIINICPYYYWDNTAIYDFLRKINARSYGVYYTSPYIYYYDYEDSELPMDMLQVAGKLPDIFTGGVECFEINWAISTGSFSFYSGRIFSWDFRITLSTNHEQDDITVPFYFYIN